ncbi:hypothetical protein NECAME_16410 [Necator americanus]|uniref:Uncharacterized protein n=1 Tax=Necator americanus TaxID=51031 RepID=W2TZ63_NECAM|nr:hypothetical protein NECAME_16410 [Necator americanus]ETN86317.1 hypothetical protein NECAME_16410 [Necator americanus]
MLSSLKEHITKNKTAFKDVACAVLQNQWEWATIFLGVILNGAYGMSELCMASHMPDAFEGQPFGSVGKLLSNLEMKKQRLN